MASVAKKKQRRWSQVAYQADQLERAERKRARAKRKEQRRQMNMKGQRVVCPNCGEPAQLVDGSVIYPFRPNLHGRPFYLCAPCHAWVGCHPGTTKPLGIPADAETRQARIEAHDVFDPIWKTGRLMRVEAYAWLADELRIEREQCHISRFGTELCRQTVRVCERYWAQQTVTTGANGRSAVLTHHVRSQAPRLNALPRSARLKEPARHTPGGLAES